MKRARTITIVAALAALSLLAFGASGAWGARPPLLWQVPEAGPQSGSGTGAIDRPLGVAADQSSGNVYVADEANHRVDVFTVWGEFVRAFGWNVDASNPEEKLQVCTAQSGCQAGSDGGGTGQLAGPQGLAVDATGDLYVYESTNRRVQKFDSEGHFLLMFGGGVNKTKVEAGAPEAERNRCPVDPGDVCQQGSKGSGPGAFSTQSFGAYLAIGPGNTVYVGDIGRVQKFNVAGEFIGEAAGVEAGQTVRALAVDSTGNLYLSYGGKPDVFELSPAGGLLQTFPVVAISNLLLEGPQTIAVGPSGNLYAVENPASFGTVDTDARIVIFDAAGDRLIPSEEEVEEQKQREELEEELLPYFGEIVGLGITGLATSSACGISGEDLFATYLTFGSSLLRSYGPHPDAALCPPPERPPAITEQYATAVSAESATLGAKISSNFWPTTTYYVEWGTGKCSEGGCTNQQPLAPGTPLNSETNLAVATKGVILSGLQPGTVYHYRFLARTSFQPGSGEVAVVKGVGGKPGFDGGEATFETPPLPAAPRSDCPNQAFRTASSAKLADCRAYEMVSPLDKEGGDVLSLGAIIEGFRASFDAASEDGEKLTYSAYRPFGGSVSAPYTSQYLTSRGAQGWNGTQISPPRGRAVQGPAFSSETEFKSFSSDLCHGWLRLEFEPEPALDPDELQGYSNLLRRDQCGSEAGYEALITTEPPHVAPPFFNPELQGTSADGRCAVIRAQDSLVPEAPFLGETAMQLYLNCEGTTRLVSFLPNGKALEGPSTAGTAASSETSPQYQHRTASLLGATSADGKRIYWTAAGEGAGKIYLRINADQPQSTVASNKCTEPEKACTLLVSEKAGSENAIFWAAASDGSRAYFTTGSEKLFEYDASDPAKAKATQLATGVKGVMGSSADGTRVYFASTGVLAPGAVAGQPNLYFREAGGTPELVGTLSPADVEGLSGELSETAAIALQPFARNARVTPDGLHAAFLSASPELAEQTAGFDNTDQATGKPDAEVYLYDANAGEGEGRLLCASCDPSGTRPRGRNLGGMRREKSKYFAAARLPRWTNDLYASRPLAADGDRLFFDSFVPLVGRDTNGKADVYEWQSAGSQAACEEIGGERFSPASGGCLSLISSGESSLDSEFLDASASGDDVFFTTAASLLTQDPGLIDVYDARVGGGFPPPPTPPAGCEGEACQGPPAAPNDPTPASAALQGQGNAKPQKPRCRKPKVLRKGRCIKPKANKHASKQRRAGAKGRTHR